MSEWDQGDWRSKRSYVPDVLVGSAASVAYKGVHDWYFFDETVVRGEPFGEEPTEADAREACDAAAVAWVLIALARRLSAWAARIDAELARRYREACARTDAASEADEVAQTEASGAARKEAWIAQGRALDALVRGAL